MAAGWGQGENRDPWFPAIQTLEPGFNAAPCLLDSSENQGSEDVLDCRRCMMMVTLQFGNL